MVSQEDLLPAQQAGDMPPAGYSANPKVPFCFVLQTLCVLASHVLLLQMSCDLLVQRLLLIWVRNVRANIAADHVPG